MGPLRSIFVVARHAETDNRAQLTGIRGMSGEMSVHKSIIFIAIAVLFLIQPLSAFPEVRKLEMAMVLEGQCKELKLPQIYRNVTCKPHVFHFAWSDGRTSFMFHGNAAVEKSQPLDVLVTFTGRGNVRTTVDSAMQPIDGIIFGYGRKDDPTKEPNQITAVGKCAYFNPFKGQPTTVECQAETAQGTFLARFITDGNRPKPLSE
jgi:hypothetical protein